MIRKTFALKSSDLGDRRIRFVGSDESLDRDGEIVSLAGWDISNYMKNPVVLYGHNYIGLPIAKTQSIAFDQRAKQMVFDIYFPSIKDLSSDPENPSEHALTVDAIYNMAKIGLLNATSVGFRGLDYEPTAEGRKWNKQELMEISIVPIPSNPNAVSMLRSAGVSDVVIKGVFMEEKGAIPFKHYPLADEGVSWDAGAIVRESEPEELRQICAWFDSSADDTKTAYKLLHHMAKADGYKTVWRGVAAAMGALVGARGGVDIPDGDKKKVYAHLAAHYKEFDKEVPDMKSTEADTTKSGRRLSQDSQEELAGIHGKLSDAHKCMKDALDSMKEFMGRDTTPNVNDEESSNVNQAPEKYVIDIIGKGDVCK